MVPNYESLDARVTALEKLVTDLRSQLTAAPIGWLDHLTGSISDPEAFEEAMRLGREFRKTGRLLDQADDADPGP
jgi:hypothetical protein